MSASAEISARNASALGFGALLSPLLFSRKLLSFQLFTCLSKFLRHFGKELAQSLGVGTKSSD